jgi:hypothetical protein
MLPGEPLDVCRRAPLAAPGYGSWLPNVDVDDTPQCRVATAPEPSYGWPPTGQTLVPARLPGQSPARLTQPKAHAASSRHDPPVGVVLRPQILGTAQEKEYRPRSRRVGHHGPVGGRAPEAPRRPGIGSTPPHDARTRRNRVASGSRYQEASRSSSSLASPRSLSYRRRSKQSFERTFAVVVLQTLPHAG